MTTELYERFLALRKQPRESFDASDVFGKVLIIDGLNTYIRCFAAVPTMNDDGEHIGGITGFLKSVGAAIRMVKPTRVIIAFDGAGGSQRRRKIFPEYKQNRRPGKRLNRTYDFADADAESESMKKQSGILAQMLSSLPVITMAPPKVEADDVIAFLAHLVSARGGKSVIMSNDKDFLQIVNENITIWNPIKKRMMQVDSIVEEYGIHPNNFVVFRALDGDKSDNIPGVRGIGPKTAIKMFPQLGESDLFSIEDLLEFAGEQKKGKLFEDISNSHDIVKRNYKLMQLETGQMSRQTRLDVLNRVDTAEISMEKADLVRLMSMNRMMGAFRNLDQWLFTTFIPLTRFCVGSGT